MSKNIYVGNLPFSATEEAVRTLFEEFGEVRTVNLIKDRDTGQLRGFGFVEMADQGANQAINALNDREMGGRKLRVNEAKPREDNRGSGGRDARRW